MSANGLDVFDKTLQTTHIWLDELMAEIGPDRQVAWHVLGTVLRAVRDRIPLELAVHLGASCRCWCAASTTTSGMRSVAWTANPVRLTSSWSHRRAVEPDPADECPRGNRCGVHGPVPACGSGAGRGGQACPSGRGAGPLARGRHVGGGGA